MNAKTIGAGVAAGLTLFAAGAATYLLVLSGYFDGQLVDPSVMKDPPQIVHIVIAELLFGWLLAMLLGQLGARDFAAGARHGAVIGLLIGLAAGLLQFATISVSSLQSYLVDGVVWAVRWAIAGGVAALILGRGAQAAAAD